MHNMFKSLVAIDYGRARIGLASGQMIQRLQHLLVQFLRMTVSQTGTN